MNTLKTIMISMINKTFNYGKTIVLFPIALFGIVFSVIAIAIGIGLLSVFGFMILMTCMFQSSCEFVAKKSKKAFSKVKAIPTKIALFVIYTAFVIRNTTKPWV